MSSHMRHRQLSVIIPFFNAEATLQDCLEAFCRLPFPGLEILVVDNNSDDGSTDIAKRMAEDFPDRFVYLAEPRQGPSYARNTGADHATGEVLAFVDADCVPAPDWASSIVSSFSKSAVGAVAGRIQGFGTVSALDKFHYLFTLKELPESRTYREFTLVSGGFPTANLAVKKTVFDAIGGFDETMRIYSEDYDLCARIYRAGFVIRYTSEALVYHKHRNTLKGTWKQSYGFGTGHAVLLKKHFKRLMIIDLPRYRYLTKTGVARMWVDLAGADKKLLAMTAVSFFWWPLFFVIPAYLILLYRDMGRRLARKGLTAGKPEKWQMAFLMVFKSAALTAGRLAGSFRHGVLCI